MAETREEIVAMIREYARVNMDECSAGVLGDPILRGHSMTSENAALSEAMQLQSTIHSSKYHAAKDILSLMGEDTSDM